MDHQGVKFSEVNAFELRIDGSHLDVTLHLGFPRSIVSHSQQACCHIDSQNHQVIGQHLAYAALDHPLSLQYDEKHFVSCLGKA
ncbi:hypothetical protein AALP_AA5G149000 [Arabis alpina]|uniref:ATP-dependent helicase HRQ1 winged helix domain-containing protein n=1 Tax=Arabis alpina TaxID=50452 RepID=A0A087GX65_ARAAL|nr:hypothetical protein AALP_AA5G149000 [Arabis alpina]